MLFRSLGHGAASALYVVSDPETRELLALKHVRATEASERRFLEQAEREHQVGSKVTSPRPPAAWIMSPYSAYIPTWVIR